jgi:hypothetical protein
MIFNVEGRRGKAKKCGVPCTLKCGETFTLHALKICKVSAMEMNVIVKSTVMIFNLPPVEDPILGIGSNTTSWL